MTETLLVLGATSAIAQAVARQHATAGWRILLVARQPERLASIAADLTARGAAAVESHVLDLVDGRPRRGHGRVAGRGRARPASCWRTAFWAMPPSTWPTHWPPRPISR